MTTVNLQALDFIDLAERLVNLLREAFYSIENHPAEGGIWDAHLYKLDDDERELLRDAADGVYWRLRGLVADDRRARVREATAAAAKLVLSWQQSPYHARPDEQAYQGQEILQNASSLLQETIHDIIIAQQPSEEQAEPNDQPENGMDWPAKAIGYLWQHRDWSIDEVAERVGKSRQALYAHPDVHLAIKARGEQKRAPSTRPRGEKDGETGKIEAWQ